MSVLEPKPRQEFLSAVVEPDVNVRASIELHQMTRDGAVEEKALQTVTLFHAASIETPQEERVQILAGNTDSGKLYLFGRSPRLYAVTGFIVDSDLATSASGQTQGLNEDDRAYRGHLLRRWMELYEKELRLSKCLKNNRILKLKWRTTEVYGYILGQARSMEFGSSNMYSVGLTFAVVFDEEMIEEPVSRVPDGRGGTMEIPGMISYENVDRIINLMGGKTDRPPVSDMGKDLGSRTRVPPRVTSERMDEAVPDEI